MQCVLNTRLACLAVTNAMRTLWRCRGGGGGSNTFCTVGGFERLVQPTDPVFRCIT
jgi:hypothetical protein